jgi:hypothetical protein
MSYVGVDPSLTNFAAVAVTSADDRMPETLLVRSNQKGARRLDDIRRLFCLWLEKIHAQDPIEHVVVEGYANGMKFGREAMGEIGGLTRLCLYDALGDVEVGYPTIVQPNQLKIFAGCGVKKQEMLLTIYKRWGVEFREDNVADAFVLAQVACALEVGAPFEFQSALLQRIKRHPEWEPLKLKPSRAAKKTSSG